MYRIEKSTDARYSTGHLARDRSFRPLQGQMRVEELTSRHKEDTGIIDSVIDSLLEHTKRLDQGVLSAAAKVDFIASHRKEPVTVEDVKLAANDLGWTLTDAQLDPH